MFRVAFRRRKSHNGDMSQRQLKPDLTGSNESLDDFLARLRPLSGQTFRAELLDVAVGPEFIVAMQHVTASSRGRCLDITGCQLMRLEQGRIVEVRGHYSDEKALDAFWVTG